MNRKKLKKKLIELGIDKSRYSLNGKLKPDALNLTLAPYLWLVIHTDKAGNRDTVKSFASEEKACHYIYEFFKGNPPLKLGFDLN